LFAGCPTEVTITSSTGNYEEGAVLTCAADGYLPSYTWTGAAGVNRDFITVVGSTYTLPEGEFDLMCTATVGELSCCASAVVSDRAERKYQKQQRQLNNLVTVLMVMTASVCSTVHGYCLRYQFRQYTCIAQDTIQSTMTTFFSC